MTAWHRKPRTVKYPAGPPSAEALPWGTLSWADDTDAEAWAAMLPLLGSDQETTRRVRDGRIVTGHLLHATVHREGRVARRVARIVWWDGERWIGRVYGSLAGAYDAWKRWLATSEEVEHAE